MKKMWILFLGVAMGITLAVPLTVLASSHGQDGVDSHATMHEMMDAMLGDGTVERMHATMPGSEAMMEECASMTETAQSMDGMMEDDRMMDGMGGMMNMMRGMGAR